jgi:hypothetical protein
VLFSAVVTAVAFACGSGGGMGDGGDGDTQPLDVPDASVPDAGTDAGGEEPDGGGDDAGLPDGGEPADGGEPITGGPGPWPTDPVTDLGATYALGVPQSAGFDEAMNLWLLDGDRIGVLRPGDAEPTWTQGVGQAAGGFGESQRALGSTVICGGAPGRAYVGYFTYDLSPAFIAGPSDEGYDAVRFEEFQKGDLDAVRLAEDGSVILEEHLWRSIGVSGGKMPIGIRNTNDWHYDEDRSVFTCKRVTRGPFRGDLYIGTNHGVTRIQGLVYNSHRHPVWDEGGSLRIGYSYGLGIAPNGDVLIANEWMVGILAPTASLREWDREETWEGPVPWKYKGYNEVLNGLLDFDYWRAFEQTASGAYYLGSKDFGVWQLSIVNRSTATWTKLEGLPTDAISTMQATDDGSLYIGTNGSGLWKLAADGTLSRVDEVPGSRVRTLVYEPELEPSMLLVLTNSGATLLRGP